MLSHGLVSAALFLCVGVVYDRMHTREIAAYGGLVNRMPIYAFCFMVFTMANVGLPGTSGFVGEFLTLLGAFKANTAVAFFATTGVVLSAAYALYLYRRVIFGELEKPALKTITDMRPREIAILGAAGGAYHLLRLSSKAGSGCDGEVGQASSYRTTMLRCQESSRAETLRPPPQGTTARYHIAGRDMDLLQTFAPMWPELVIVDWRADTHDVGCVHA